MKIYLIRHATAEDPAGKEDAARRLIERGREEARIAGRALRALEARVGTVLSSPLARARETAELLAAELSPAAPVETREGLACGAAPEAFREALAGAPPGGEVAVVAHQPDLGRFVADLLGLGPNAHVPFRPSTVYAIELRAPGGPAKLLWRKHPDELAAAARDGAGGGPP
jgi:phosphohistidine phosphatase